ncbi:pentapeptide repeat-containing protein [Vampirovibrio sp.]|uniref:pentapeptide repeat-containing protein n=1 Tax=Vampirovibrio sp. TaxID=2717857 RepID=UPI0035934E63
MADPHALNLIQEEKFLEFNNFVDSLGGQVDLTGAHLRGYDLRKCKLQKADLTGAYLRSADLRSVDLSEAKLDGASMKEARVSGVLFPRELSAQEIQLSLASGTRLRTKL